MVLILDGALGTELEKRLDGDACPKGDPLWSGKVLIQRPEVVERVHQDYVRSGADLVTTSTYQIAYANLARSGYTAREITDVWASAVAVARKAVLASGNDVRIVGSVGPYGCYVNDGSEYTGKYHVGEAELVEHHRPLVEFLQQHQHVDIIGLETVPNLDEVKALLALMKSKRFFLSLSVANGTLADGTSLHDVLALVQHNPLIVAIGVNCLRYTEVPRYLDQLQGPVPLIAYPNYGYVADEKGEYVSKSDLHGWTKAVGSWKQYNLAIVGGCCGTSPQEIQVLREQFS